MGSISSVFGYILNFIYEIVKNYGLAIIIFSILLKALLLPLSIKQQKTMKKSAKIQNEVKSIQSKYKNNPEQMNRETMDLYKRENMSPFSGCIVSILQIIIILAMFYLVRSPLTFMKKVDGEQIERCKTQIKEEQGEAAISAAYPEISVIKYVNNILKEGIVEEKKEEINTIIEEEKIEEVTSQTEEPDAKTENVEVDYDNLYINMDFLGLDLSNVPKENYKDITVFIIPVLYVITSIISMKLTTRMTAGSNTKKDELVLSGDKDKEENKEDMAMQMNKSMSLFLPIMSVMISLIAPLGLALYWLVNNILMIAERVLLDKFLKDKEE